MHSLPTTGSSIGRAKRQLPGSLLTVVSLATEVPYLLIIIVAIIVINYYYLTCWLVTLQFLLVTFSSDTMT